MADVYSFRGHYRYHYTDHRMDTSSVLRHNGNSLHSFNYEEFGNFYDVNGSPGDASNFTDPHAHYLHSGKEWDEESALNYFGARFYDPWSGTWLSQDSFRGNIFAPVTQHRYLYNQNNALRYYDPDGRIVAELTDLGMYIQGNILNPLSQGVSGPQILQKEVIQPYVENYNAQNTWNKSYQFPYTNLTITAEKETNASFEFVGDDWEFNAAHDAYQGVAASTSGHTIGTGVSQNDSVSYRYDEGLLHHRVTAWELNLDGQTYAGGHIAQGDHRAVWNVRNMSAQSFVNESVRKNYEQTLVQMQRAKEERLQREKEIAYLNSLDPVAREFMQCQKRGEDYQECYRVMYRDYFVEEVKEELPGQLHNISSYGLEILPISGDFSDGYTCVMGSTPFTNQQTDCGDVAGFASLPILTYGQIRALDDLSDLGRRIYDDFAEYAAEVRKATEEVLEAGTNNALKIDFSDSSRFISGVTILDNRTGQIFEGTVDIQPTIDRINAGQAFPHRNDGSIFQNRPLEGKTVPELPQQQLGYYTEYVVPTPGIDGPGPQRLVIGEAGDIWYTSDHYQNFIPVNP